MVLISILCAVQCRFRENASTRTMIPQVTYCDSRSREIKRRLLVSGRPMPKRDMRPEVFSALLFYELIDPCQCRWTDRRRVKKIRRGSRMIRKRMKRPNNIFLKILYPCCTRYVQRHNRIITLQHPQARRVESQRQVAGSNRSQCTSRFRNTFPCNASHEQ